MSNFYFLILICVALHFIHYDVNCNIILGSFKTCYVVKQKIPRNNCQRILSSFKTISTCSFCKYNMLSMHSLYTICVFRTTNRVIARKFCNDKSKWYNHAIKRYSNVCWDYDAFFTVIDVDIDRFISRIVYKICHTISIVMRMSLVLHFK